MKGSLTNDRGIALLLVLLLMLLILCTTGAGLFFSGINLRTSNNIKAGSGAIHAADAAVQHGLALIPPGVTFSYGSEAVLVNNHSFGNGYAYTVRVLNDSASSGGNSRAILTAEASGPNGTLKKVRSYVGRASIFEPPGAVYVPGTSSSDADFDTSGTFYISGNDTNYTDSNGDGRSESTSAGPRSSVLGVATSSQDMVNEFLSSLSNAEKTRVQGKNYNPSTNPVTPSIEVATSGLDVGELATALKSQVTAASCPPKCLNGYELSSSQCPSSNPCRLGTDASPQVTYIKEGSDHIHFDGHVYGSGVLIVEGKAHFHGHFEFHGLVISLAPGALSGSSDEEDLKLRLKNNARIFGSLLLGPNQDALRFDIKDNAAIYYSSQGLSKAIQTGSCCIPMPPKLIAWHELAQ